MAAAGAEHVTRRPRAAARPVAATPQAVAVIDREGMVLAIIASGVEARAFLREGRL